MFLSILKAFIIGICASAPIGPIAILVIQKSLSKGHKAGFITGMGACIVDTFFSIIAIFFLAMAQEFLNENKELILVGGGLVVAVIGVFMTKADPFRKLKSSSGPTAMMKDFLQAIVMGLSNPGAILVIFALFAFFGIGNSQEPHLWKVTPVIISVSLGAATYWFLVSWLLSHFRKKFRMSSLLLISRITGVAVIIIGIALVGEGLYRVVFMGMPLF